MYEMLKAQNVRPVVVASHPRSGTHLLMDLMRKQFDDCKIKRNFFEFQFQPYVNLDEIVSVNAPVSMKELKIITRASLPIVKTHRLPNFYEAFQFLNPVFKKREWLANYFKAESIIIYIGSSQKSVRKNRLRLFSRICG